MADPLGFTRDRTEVVFESSNSLDEVLDLLGAPEADPVTENYKFNFGISGYQSKSCIPSSPSSSDDSGTGNAENSTQE